MTTTEATRKRRARQLEAARDRAASQHQSSPKGQQHTDFQTLYDKREDPYELFHRQFRLSAYVGGDRFDIGSLVEQFTWADAGDPVIIVANQQLPLTGTLQMRKPSLAQYKTLLPAFAAATMRRGSSRYGAIGTVIQCEVGFGKTFHPLWSMRVSPGQSQAAAEQVTLSDGTWSLQLVDDLQLLSESMDDYKFTSGKKVKKLGWRADEITIAVCQQMSIPIKSLPRGTARFHLPAAVTTSSSPLAVISQAWQEETNRTGKNFVIRWSVPDKRHPTGALEITSMRRNKNLLRFREQIIDAVLTRSQQNDYATVLLGRAKLREKHGKTKQITYLARNDAAIHRYGWVHKIVDFSPVQSHLELEILTKRSLAMRLTPLRTAELTHPGIATIRRGDAVRIDIPEEGYTSQKERILTVPSTGRGISASARAILAGEGIDPSLFGLPDENALSPIAATANLSNAAAALTQDTPVVLPVADQGIAFVASVTHTVTADTYDMDMVMQFVDVLDPLTVKAQTEANLRAAKATSRSAKGSKGGAGNASTSGGWRVVASAEVMGGTGSCGHAIVADGYSELSTVPQGTGSDFHALGGLACDTQLIIINPANGKSVTTGKQDVGAGSSFLPVMGIYPGTRAKLGLSGGEFHVVIKRADGGALHPVRGRQV